MHPYPHVYVASATGEQIGEVIVGTPRLPDLSSLECQVEGSLERVDGITRFTQFKTFAKLTVPKNTNAGNAQKLLERAEHVCLISNSLNGERLLQTDVLVNR
jgi:organic hydroperoxide reductase OsmC/OhrA